MTTQLWVGLGNPGQRHARDRHNIGRLVLDAIARHHGFGAWRKGRFCAQVADGKINGAAVRAILPDTFMNLSGKAVFAAARFWRIEAADILVLHDELDLPGGKVRIKTGGGDAGHNGLRSITEAIGPGYRRLRLGIGRTARARDHGTSYVLAPFSESERSTWLEPLIASVVAQSHLLAEASEKAEGQFISAIHQAMLQSRSVPDIPPR